MIHVEVSTIVRRLILVLCMMVGAAPLSGQSVISKRARSTPLDSVLLHFERDVRARVINSPGSDLVFTIISLPAAFAPRRDSLLDGLERMALSSDNEHVRHVAAARIAFAGRVDETASPLPGIMARLTRIYHAHADPLVRISVRNSMPEQADRRAAAAFLRTVAAEADPTNDGSGPHGLFSVGDPRTEALSRLAEMGAEGRAVLQAMHRSGEARSPQARATLARMAQRGFPVIDARRREQ
jgi:hypothetical protein